MMDEVVSVIIPVYNAQAYLIECLDSLQHQTYSKLQIILIDDGSIDESGTICDQYAGKDTRATVIHQKNGGAANAKNAGLKIASGTYLAFLDSDDYLEPDTYEYMVKKLNEYAADAVQCGFRDVYKDTVEEHISIPEERTFSTVEYLKRYTVDWTCGLLWDKLFRRELFDGIFFEEGHIVDDEFFTYQGMMRAKTVLYAPKVVYNYRKRRSSIMNSPISQQRIVMDKLDYLEKRRKDILQCFPELKQDIDYHFLSMLVILARNPAATRESILTTKRLLREYAKEKNKTKIEFILQKEIYLLMHQKPESILKRRSPNPKQKKEMVLFD